MTDQPNPTPSFEDLINQVTNGSPNDPDAQWQAAIALGEVTDEGQRTQAISALAQAYSNVQSHALIRAHVAESLTRLGDAAALPTLRQAIADNYRLVRAYAMPGYTALADATEVINTLTPIAENDPFFGVRAEAIASLANKAVNQPDTVLRQQVIDFLNARRPIELAQTAPGTERIIAEIDRGLQRLTT